MKSTSVTISNLGEHVETRHVAIKEAFGSNFHFNTSSSKTTLTAARFELAPFRTSA